MAFILREYQQGVKDKILSHWEKGYKNVLLVLPTGLGKTVTFCSIANDLAILASLEKRMPTAILVHRKELIQQICLTLAHSGIMHNIIAPRPVILSIVASERLVLGKSFYDYNAKITVISVDTLNSRILKHKDWAKSIRFWIMDEAAHLLKNNKWGRSLKYFTNAIGLGVTATPERLDKRGLGAENDGVFEVMVEGPSTRWGIDNGFLSKYKVVIPESDYRKHLKESKGDADYSKEAMALASNKSHIIGDVVVNYKKFINGKQAILFASDITTAHKMEENFNNSGISAKLLTGDTEGHIRTQTVFDFRDKKIQVLLNVDLFDEGFDVPGIEAVILARPTRSLSKFLQMCGRGLRPSPDKPYMVIIDHVGNISDHGLPCKIRRWSLDRPKKKRKLNFIRICPNPFCNSVFDRILSTCPYCGHEDKKDNSQGRSGRVSPQQVDGDLVLLDPETLRELQESTILEDPGKVGERVSRFAGAAAGIKATKNQQERIDMQKKLVGAIAEWAGKMRREGLSDREIHKSFFIHMDMTIDEALGKPRAEMERIFKKIEGELCTI